MRKIIFLNKCSDTNNTTQFRDTRLPLSNHAKEFSNLDNHYNNAPKYYSQIPIDRIRHQLRNNRRTRANFTHHISHLTSYCFRRDNFSNRVFEIGTNIGWGEKYAIWSVAVSTKIEVKMFSRWVVLFVVVTVSVLIVESAKTGNNDARDIITNNAEFIGGMIEQGKNANIQNYKNFQHIRFVLVPTRTDTTLLSSERRKRPLVSKIYN